MMRAAETYNAPIAPREGEHRPRRLVRVDLLLGLRGGDLAHGVVGRSPHPSRRCAGCHFQFDRDARGRFANTGAASPLQALHTSPSASAPRCEVHLRTTAVQFSGAPRGQHATLKVRLLVWARMAAAAVSFSAKPPSLWPTSTPLLKRAPDFVGRVELLAQFNAPASSPHRARASRRASCFARIVWPSFTRGAKRQAEARAAASWFTMVRPSRARRLRASARGSFGGLFWFAEGRGGRWQRHRVGRVEAGVARHLIRLRPRTSRPRPRPW